MKLSIQIVRFVDERQPGWVECQFVDVDGKLHAIVDKVVVLTDAQLDGYSAYPQPGWVACEVLSRSEDSLGRSLSHISTARPYDIESTDGSTEFVVLSEQLSP